MRGSGVADAADLVPFGHPAHFLLVDGLGRRCDGASGGDGQRRAGKDFSVASILSYRL